MSTAHPTVAPEVEDSNSPESIKSLRFKHYSIRTEQAYPDWIRRFILFHAKHHPAEMGAPEVEAFLTHLATVGRVAASTQNRALSALLFLYREVLEIELPGMENMQRAKRSQKGGVLTLLFRFMGCLENPMTGSFQVPYTPMPLS